MNREMHYGGALILLLAAGGCHLILGLDEYELDTGICTSDGVRNGSETDIDCGGGACPPCADQRGCAVGSDCANKVCVSGTCLAPTCDDKIKNGGEIDVDCGGTCGKCGPGQACTEDGGCKSGVCMGGACQSTCMDLVKGDQETDIDCGGPDCPACPNDKVCATGADCQSKFCKDTTCLSPFVWNTSIVGSSNLYMSDVLVDEGGNAFLAGKFGGTLDFGVKQMTANGTDDMFVARLDPSGKYTWEDHFGYSGIHTVSGIGLDGSGNIFLSGTMNGQTSFGGPTHTSALDDVVIASFNQFTSFRWSMNYGDSMPQKGNGIAVDKAGNVVVVGQFKGSLNIGAVPLISSGGDDAFVARLDNDGKSGWSERFGDAADQAAKLVAADNNSNIIMVGDLEGSADFGGGALSAVGSADRFFVKLGKLGNHLWSKRFDSSGGGVEFTALAVDGSDNIILVGYMFGTIDLGGGPLSSTGVTSVLVSKFDASGKHLWSKAFGGDLAVQACGDVAVDVSGNIFIVGVFQKTIDLGGGLLTSAGASDVFVAKLDPSGNHLWSERFGDAEEQSGTKIAVQNDSAVLVAGEFKGTIDFGGGPMTASGNTNVFLAKLRTP